MSTQTKAFDRSADSFSINASEREKTASLVYTRQGGDFSITLRATDQNLSITNAAEALSERLVREHLLEPGRQLVEVKAFFDLRDKAPCVDGDLASIALDRDEAEVKRRVALRDLKGEKLLGALARIDEALASLDSRISQCHAGKRAFDAALRESRAAATTALTDFFAEKIPGVVSALKQILADLQAKIEASIGSDDVLPLLRDVAAANSLLKTFADAAEDAGQCAASRAIGMTSTAYFSRHQVFERRVLAILDEPQAAAGDAA